MIYKATKLIKTEMDRKGMKYRVRETDTLSLVELAFKEDNYSADVRFFSSDDDNDVAVRTEEFAKYPEARRPAGLELLNRLNRKFKYAKFVMDPEDGAVCAEYDFPLRLSDSEVGPVAIEIATRLSDIVNSSYPDIMKSIWGG